MPGSGRASAGELTQRGWLKEQDSALSTIRPNKMKRWVIILIVLAMLAAAAAVGPDWMPDNSPLIPGELL